MSACFKQDEAKTSLTRVICNFLIERMPVMGRQLGFQDLRITTSQIESNYLGSFSASVFKAAESLISF